MSDTASTAESLCRDLRALAREDDRLCRTLHAHRLFIDAIDWTAMTRSDRRLADQHGVALAWHRRCIGQAIDQRLFELIHAGEA